MCQLVGVCLEVGIAWFCYPVFGIHRLPDQHVIYDHFLINFASSSLHSNNFKLISEKPHFILKTTQVLLQPKEFLTKPSEYLPAETTVPVGSQLKAFRKGIIAELIKGKKMYSDPDPINPPNFAPSVVNTTDLVKK